jgi:hypothetical protein
VDPRYQNEEKRQRIAALYFPFLLVAIDNFSSIIQSKDIYEKKCWIICFLTIVKGSRAYKRFLNITGISTKMLRDWWKQETQVMLNHIVLM